MNFSGFLKTTLIDYPDTLASVVYLPKCNFRCGYCHNSDLVFYHSTEYDEELIINHLKKRKGIIDGIVITGGEPTLHNDLFKFMKKVKDLGVKVKLDTNGYKPDVIKKIIENNLVDYIAMDIKNTYKNYANTVSINNFRYDNIKESINIIINSGIEYEFRTTLIKEFHSTFDVLEMGNLINGAKKYVLQQYEYSDKQIIDKKYSFFTVEEMEVLKNELKLAYNIGKILIRGRF